ncbi:hypothetical protein BDR05DRAFT_953621 [Suillus weaverae]|nr:hypothetical protein BDR05DRAFT_953621 [Suillus weaverae]
MPSCCRLVVLMSTWAQLAASHEDSWAPAVAGRSKTGLSLQEGTGRSPWKARASKFKTHHGHDLQILYKARAALAEVRAHQLLAEKVRGSEEQSAGNKADTFENYDLSVLKDGSYSIRSGFEAQEELHLGHRQILGIANEKR